MSDSWPVPSVFSHHLSSTSLSGISVTRKKDESLSLKNFQCSRKGSNTLESAGTEVSSGYNVDTRTEHSRMGIWDNRSGNILGKMLFEGVLEGRASLSPAKVERMVRRRHSNSFQSQVCKN